ncbi:hypothetical protein EYF80_035053 [Liparis tanakae]|uniref:Uncharacterized protein n=1 Tax=Liparis tanakae TaxID=230148 RepID=A0A4Z2GN91_9TELE|nr:hypothetical protein EYF80_035053 [Liparis tanakae]
MDVNTHHADFRLLAGARGADQGLQLVSDPLVVLQHLSQLLHKVLSLARVVRDHVLGKDPLHQQPEHMEGITWI